MLSRKPYQDDGYEFLRARTHALLGDDPGTGKTRQLIDAAVEPALIVAPAYGQSVWRDEIALWRPNLEHVFVSYSSLTQRERGGKTIGVPRPEYGGEWATLIFDESHYLKGRKTKWTEAALKLQSQRTWLATGTPIPNWAHELWVNLRLLKPNDKFLKSYWRWVKFWFTTWNPHYAPSSIEVGGLLACTDDCKEVERCEHWEEFFVENLGGLYLARSIDDVLPDLPPLREQYIECPMTQVQAKVYRQLKKDYRACVDDIEISVWSDGELASKLHKVVTGVGVATGGGATESGKLNVLKDLLRDRKPPLVIFCWYRDTADTILQLVRDAGLSVALRSGAVSRKAQDAATDAFKSGAVDVLVGTLATTSESITLTRASTCIFVERSWRPSTNAQAMKRLRRLGQTKPVDVLHLVTRATVDSRMVKVLQTKTDQQMRALRPVDFADLL